MPIDIIRAPTDPICTRVSVGGTQADGFYVVYRGTLDDSITCLRNALKGLEVTKATGSEPAINNHYQKREFS